MKCLRLLAALKSGSAPTTTMSRSTNGFPVPNKLLGYYTSPSSLARLQQARRELRLFSFQVMPVRGCTAGERSVGLNTTGKLAMAVECSSLPFSLWGRDCRGI